MASTTLIVNFTWQFTILYPEGPWGGLVVIVLPFYYEGLRLNLTAANIFSHRVVFKM